MGYIGVISSDKDINNKLENIFSDRYSSVNSLLFLEEQNKAMEFLNYDLPELLVFNLSDKSLDINKILNEIKNDRWLHNFGIIGLYDRSTKNELDLLKKLKDINVLVFLDFSMIESHFLKCFRLILKNAQMIFQKNINKNLMDHYYGSLTIENDPTSASLYAGLLATGMVQRGLLNSENKIALQLALSELILNGIEHGNCGISYSEKTKALEDGKDINYLINIKNKNPEISSKKVFVEWESGNSTSRFVIRDQGAGFDVKAIVNRKNNSEEFHGRGIMMASQMVNKIVYNLKGNQVSIIINHDNNIVKTIPEGFLADKVISVNKNDIVFKEGEPGDHLYYISSGKFSVFHKLKHVGILGPEDVFLGEMAFLLNNRRSATVRAETEAKIIKISRRSFVKVIKEFPHYGIFLSRLLSKKIIRSNAMNANIQEKLN